MAIQDTQAARKFVTQAIAGCITAMREAMEVLDDYGDVDDERPNRAMRAFSNLELEVDFLLMLFPEADKE